MCKWLVTRIMLGRREQGWGFFDGKGSVEMTEAQIIKALKEGKEIRGLKISENGKSVELDEKLFYTNCMEHRHVDNYVPFNTIEGLAVNAMYYVIGSSVIENGSVQYEIVSNRFERKTVSAEELGFYSRMGMLGGGAKVNEDGSVELPAYFKNTNGGEINAEEKKTEADVEKNKENASASEDEHVMVHSEGDPVNDRMKVKTKESQDVPSEETHEDEYPKTGLFMGEPVQEIAKDVKKRSTVKNISKVKSKAKKTVK